MVTPCSTHNSVPDGRTTPTQTTTGLGNLPTKSTSQIFSLCWLWSQPLLSWQRAARSRCLTNTSPHSTRYQWCWWRKEMGPCEYMWITGAWMQYQEQMHIQWSKLKTWWINWVGRNTSVHWIRSKGTASYLSCSIYNKRLPLSLPSDFISLGGCCLGRWEPQPLSRGWWTNCWGHFVNTYLDDLVIISVSWPECLQHLRANCQSLQEAGLIAKPWKCQSWIAQRVYLRYIVGEGRVKWKLSSSKQPRSSVSWRQKRRSACSWALPEVYTQLLISGKPTYRPDVKPFAKSGGVDSRDRRGSSWELHQRFIRGHIQNGDILAAREGDKRNRGTIWVELWRSLP